MGALKNFTDELAKHRLLVYFVILWGVMLFLWTLYGMIEYGFQITSALSVLDLLFHLSELFTGLVLILLGTKLLKTNFIEALKNEKLLVYFLILWGASFLFWGLYFMIDFGPPLFEEWQNIIGFLGNGLAAFVAGIALELFSWKMLTNPE